MSLRDLITKSDSGGFATATLATLATQEPETAASVATVATVAVATAEIPKPHIACAACVHCTDTWQCGAGRGRDPLLNEWPVRICGAYLEINKS